MLQKTNLKRNYLFVYLFIIFLGIVLPINNKESTINHTYVFSLRLDYLFHILIFAPWFYFYKTLNFKINKFVWLFLGFGIAILFELIQNLIPYRTYNYFDMLFNIVGILFSFILIHLKAFKNEK